MDTFGPVVFEFLAVQITCLLISTVHLEVRILEVGRSIWPSPTRVALYSSHILTNMRLIARLQRLKFQTLWAVDSTFTLYTASCSTVHAGMERRVILYKMLHFKDFWQRSLLHSMIFTGNIKKIV